MSRREEGSLISGSTKSLRAVCTTSDDWAEPENESKKEIGKSDQRSPIRSRQ